MPAQPANVFALLEAHQFSSLRRTLSVQYPELV